MVTHKSGFFVQGWGSSDGYLNSDSGPDGFAFEVDAVAGWKGALGKRLSVRFDYANFWIGTGNRVESIENVRLFLNWKRDGVEPYARLQYFLNNGFGPGQGLAYVLGTRYKQFAVEMGSHTGLLGQSATFGSFGRIKYSSPTIKELAGANIGVQLQGGFSDPVNDQFIVNINWSF